MNIMKKFLKTMSIVLTLGLSPMAMASDAGPATDVPALLDAGQSDAGVAPTSDIPEVPTPDTDLAAFFQLLLEKAQQPEWVPLFGGALLIVVWLLRMFKGRIKWFGSKIGGYVLTFGTSLVGALGTALFAGVAFSLNLFVTSITIAAVAAGGWEALKDVLKKLRK